MQAFTHTFTLFICFYQLFKNSIKHHQNKLNYARKLKELEIAKQTLPFKSPLSFVALFAFHLT